MSCFIDHCNGKYAEKKIWIGLGARKKKCDVSITHYFKKYIYQILFFVLCRSALPAVHRTVPHVGLD